MELISNVDWTGSERNKLVRKQRRKLLKAVMFILNRYLPFYHSPGVVLYFEA
jgi:hypothetical protein